MNFTTVLLTKICVILITLFVIFLTVFIETINYSLCKTIFLKTNVKLQFSYVVVDNVDIDFTLWLWWCLAPLLITFLLPLLIVFLLYLTALILYIYKWHWKRLKDTLERGDRWEAGRKTVAAIWDAHGWIWHGKRL